MKIPVIFDPQIKIKKSPYTQQIEYKRALNFTKVQRLLSKPFIKSISVPSASSLSKHFSSDLFVVNGYDSLTLVDLRSEASISSNPIHTDEFDSSDNEDSASLLSNSHAINTKNQSAFKESPCSKQELSTLKIPGLSASCFFDDQIIYANDEIRMINRKFNEIHSIKKFGRINSLSASKGSFVAATTFDTLVSDGDSITQRLSFGADYVRFQNGNLLGFSRYSCFGNVDEAVHELADSSSDEQIFEDTSEYERNSKIGEEENCATSNNYQMKENFPQVPEMKENNEFNNESGNILKNIAVVDQKPAEILDSFTKASDNSKNTAYYRFESENFSDNKKITPKNIVTRNVYAKVPTFLSTQINPSADGFILHDIRMQDPIACLKIPTTCSAHKNNLLFIAHHSKLLIFETRTNTLLRCLDYHVGEITSIDVCDRFIVTGSADKTIRIFSLKTFYKEKNERIFVKLDDTYFSSRMQAINGVYFNTATNRVISSSLDGNLRVWKAVGHLKDKMSVKEQMYIKQNEILKNKFIGCNEIRRIDSHRFFNKELKNKIKQKKEMLRKKEKYE